VEGFNSDVKGLRWEGVEWICLVKEMEKWWGDVKMVINFRFA
jgi:hypothetical protein